MPDSDKHSTEHSAKSVPEEKALTYRDAGVDIDAGAALVEKIRDSVGRTQRPEVMGSIGGFGALCALPTGYREPLLVSGTDGVGTKLRLALDLDRHDGIGIDLVAMCANDIAVSGAEPLFFLDYYATGKLDVDVAARVVNGIARGCELAGCALVGGETAEMPGMYSGDDYDLAGFCVGVVERDGLIDGSRVKAGDALLAIASSGAHSNGYSLIRKVLERSADSLHKPLEGGGPSLADLLMEPTTLYCKALLAMNAAVDIHALAHITGGGLLDNLPRALPQGLSATVERSSWTWPTLFSWLQEVGQIDETEMLRTFNCGVGMVACLPQNKVDAAIQLLANHGLHAWPLGQVEQSEVAIRIVQ